MEVIKKHPQGWAIPLKRGIWQRLSWLAAAGFPSHLQASPEETRRQAELLLAAHGESVLRLAYSYLRSQEEAEDVLQDTFVQYLKASPALTTPEHQRAWLLRVAANRCKNRLVYQKRHPTDPLEETLAAEGREDLSFLWEAVQSLPPRQRAVIHLFYYEDLPTARIAAILQRKESTVRSDLHRGRMRLREILKEGYDFEEIP